MNNNNIKREVAENEKEEIKEVFKVQYAVREV